MLLFRWIWLFFDGGWAYILVCFCIITTVYQLLSHITFEFADRYNTALVCHRWRFLACHPHLWLRVDRTIKDLSEPGVYSSIDAAVSAAKWVQIKLAVLWFIFKESIKLTGFLYFRPGDTILIASGGVHITSNIQIKKPLCLVYNNPLFSIISLLVPSLLYPGL